MYPGSGVSLVPAVLSKKMCLRPTLKKKNQQQVLSNSVLLTSHVGLDVGITVRLVSGLNKGSCCQLPGLLSGLGAGTLRVDNAEHLRKKEKRPSHQDI